jgi:hypothetical protein
MIYRVIDLIDGQRVPGHRVNAKSYGQNIQFTHNFLIICEHFVFCKRLFDQKSLKTPKG